MLRSGCPRAGPRPVRDEAQTSRALVVFRGSLCPGLRGRAASYVLADQMRSEGAHPCDGNARSFPKPHTARDRTVLFFFFFFLSYISKRESRRFGWARGAEGASYARIAPLHLPLQHTSGESGETLCIDDKMGCETKKKYPSHSLCISSVVIRRASIHSRGMHRVQSAFQMSRTDCRSGA